MNAWGFVPARGGSKSIPLKNLVSVAGRPLLDYGITAAIASGRLDRIVCSTDSDRIAQRAIALGVDVDRRPDDLGGDAVKVDDVVREYLERAAGQGETLPDVIVLIQPTSPFLLPVHVEELLGVFERDGAARSAHNVIAVAHNSHAWNQRQLDADGRVGFLFAEERGSARLKQNKPKLMVFGNLIAARTDALRDGSGFYAEPCAGIGIDSRYGLDLDGPEDLPIAEALLSSGAIELPHMSDGSRL